MAFQFVNEVTLFSAIPIRGCLLQKARRRNFLGTGFSMKYALVLSHREAVLEVLTGMKVPSMLGEHGSFSLPESCWSLSIKRLMLILNLLAVRITANDCRKMDSSSCLSYAQAFYPAETTQPIQVMLPEGS